MSSWLHEDLQTAMSVWIFLKAPHERISSLQVQQRNAYKSVLMHLGPEERRLKNQIKVETVAASIALNTH